MATKINRPNYTTNIRTVSEATRNRNFRNQNRAELSGVSAIVNPKHVKIVTSSELKKRENTKKRKDNSLEATYSSNNKRTRYLRNGYKSPFLNVTPLDNSPVNGKEAHGIKIQNGKPIVYRKIRRVLLRGIETLYLLRRVTPKIVDENEHGESGEEDDAIVMKTTVEDYETFTGDTSLSDTSEGDYHNHRKQGLEGSKELGHRYSGTTTGNGTFDETENDDADGIFIDDGVLEQVAEIDDDCETFRDRVSRKTTITEDGQTIINETVQVAFEQIPIDVTFYNVWINEEEIVEWAMDKESHKTDLARMVSALIRNANTYHLSVLGVDYNCIRQGLGLGGKEIYNILKRTRKFALGLPSCVMCLKKLRVTRERIRIIPIWALYAFLCSLPLHVFEINNRTMQMCFELWHKLSHKTPSDVGGNLERLQQSVEIFRVALTDNEEQFRKHYQDSVKANDELSSRITDMHARMSALEGIVAALQQKNDSVSALINESNQTVEKLKCEAQEKLNSMESTIENRLSEKMKEIVPMLEKRIEAKLRKRLLRQMNNNSEKHHKDRLSQPQKENNDKKDGTDIITDKTIKQHNVITIDDDDDVDDDVGNTYSSSSSSSAVDSYKRYPLPLVVTKKKKPRARNPPDYITELFNYAGDEEGVSVARIHNNDSKTNTDNKSNKKQSFLDVVFNYEGDRKKRKKKAEGKKTKTMYAH